jgi:hypothetical protein
VLGTASYPTNGNPGGGSASSSVLTIGYDSTTQGYTVSSGGRTQTFLPSDIDAASSNSQITVYTRGSGSFTESLTLTKPGTSGSLTYQYVGTGYYQRTTTTSSTISATIDAFVYGVPTPDATVRRTGAARYDVDILGIYAFTDQPVSIRGTGTIDIDFETFRIITNGGYTEFSTTTGAQTGIGNFQGTATLSPTTNLFSGPVRVSAINATMNGLLYGPNSTEVGATISGTDALSGVAVVATLLGRKSQELVTQATNTDLVNLKKSTQFISNSQGARFALDSGGAYTGTTFRGNSNISYDADTQTYTVSSSTPSFTSGPGLYSQTFAPADADAGQTDGQFRAFTKTANGETSTLKLYKPAGSNSDIQLTHTGLGVLKTSKTGERTETWFIYGLPSNAGGTYAAATGSATYTGKVFGTAQASLASGGVGQLSGTATLSVNFAGTGSLTGQMNPIATFADNSTLTLGTYLFTLGSLNSGAPNGWQASIDGPGDDTGSIAGYFFGNLYPEFGASFFVDTFATPAANEYSLTGAIIGKKD